MDYLSYFDLTAEPFSNAPLSRFYFGSRQHADALERLKYGAATMKGLAILVGDIGLGKTTLARRLLESLPDTEYEAAMLVMVHAGITPNWLLKRIAIQLAVPEPADDKLTILSQLYQRLIEIHRSGRKAVVLIDEAQMLASRELMEEFRGLLNLEVPDQKLISFIFFGLPEIEQNLRLDPPLAQRIALRCRLAPLGIEDCHSYVRHRLALAGGDDQALFSSAALDEVYRFAQGVPRLTNTLCDNVLLEMFFAKSKRADPETVRRVAANLGMLPSGIAEPPPPEIVIPKDEPAIEGSAGFDAMVAAPRDEAQLETLGLSPGLSPDAIAAQVLSEPTVDESPSMAEFEADVPTVPAPMMPVVDLPNEATEEPLEVVPEPVMAEHAEAAALVVEPQLPEFSEPTSGDVTAEFAAPLAPILPGAALIDEVTVTTEPEQVAAATHLAELQPEGPSPWQAASDLDGMHADVPELAPTDMEVVADDELPAAGEVADEMYAAARVAPLARALPAETTDPVAEGVATDPAFASAAVPLPSSAEVHDVEVEFDPPTAASNDPTVEVEIEAEAEVEPSVEVTFETPAPIAQPPAVTAAVASPEPVSVANAAPVTPTPVAPVSAPPVPKPVVKPAARPGSRSIDLAEIDALLADLNLAPKKK